MPPRKLILGFLLRFALVYSLLIWPWPGWNDLYGQGFRAAGNALFGSSEGNRYVLFEPHRQVRGFAALDSRIVLGNRARVDSNGDTPAIMVGLSTRAIGWAPTALVIALVVATPIPWRRRAWALAGAVALVQLFVVFSVAVCIWAESPNVSLASYSPFWKQVMDGLEYTMITQMGSSFSVPLLIWILVTFRREDRWSGGP